MCAMSKLHIEQNQLFFKLCSDHLSIEAIPKKRLALDLAKVKTDSLTDYDILMWTPQFVVLRAKDGEEITLRQDGRMVIRKSGSDAAARRIAARVLSLAIGRPASQD